MGIWKDLIDALIKFMPDLIKAVVEVFQSQYSQFYNSSSAVLKIVLYSPSPVLKQGVIIGDAANSPWAAIQDAFWGEILALGYLILILSYIIGLLGKTWNLNTRHFQRSQRGLIVGIIALPASWYVSVAGLRLFNGISAALSPSFNSLQSTLFSAGIQSLAAGGLIKASLWMGGSALYITLTVIHAIRILSIFVLVASLPVLLAFDLGAFPYVSRISRRLYMLLPVLAFIPVPIAFSMKLFMLVLGNGVLNMPISSSSWVLVIFYWVPLAVGIAVPIYMVYGSLNLSGKAFRLLWLSSFLSRTVGTIAGAASGGGSSGSSSDNNSGGGTPGTPTTRDSSTAPTTFVENRTPPSRVLASAPNRPAIDSTQPPRLEGGDPPAAYTAPNASEYVQTVVDRPGSAPDDTVVRPGDEAPALESSQRQALEPPDSDYAADDGSAGAIDRDLWDLRDTDGMAEQYDDQSARELRERFRELGYLD